jgi:hypothetical protein
MKNWMHTPEWKALCWQDQDHQYHVKAYWDERFRKAAEIGDTKRTARAFNPRGCYNGVRNWYEQGYVSPTQARTPSITEDPVAYILAGD